MIKINKNKRIGNVVYIVEGARKEFTLLTKIFNNLLGFSVVQLKRNNPDPCLKYYNKESDSTVYIINTETSNIESISSGKDYLNEKFLWLYDNYDIDIHNCFVFYIFDRDHKSNLNTKLIQSLLNDLQSSTFNDTEQPGLLLINYPCIESFIIHSFEQPLVLTNSSSGEELKKYINKNNYQQNNLTIENLQTATQQVMDLLKDKFNYILNESDLDKFGSHNTDIFEKQEKYNLSEQYVLLPLIILSLIDLSLITID